MRDQSNNTGNRFPQGDRFAELDDPNLCAALNDFRASVHAWSDAAYNAPRTLPARPAVAWRRTLAWALSLVLSAGAVSGAVYERHHEKVLAAQRQHELQLERQKQLAAQRQHALDSEDLLDNIDSYVAREVPAAMEPLAQMMSTDSGSQ